MLSGSKDNKLCRTCLGKKVVFVKDATGQKSMRGCPSCGGTGNAGLKTK